MRSILALVFVLFSVSALGQDVHLPMVPVLVQPPDVQVPPELKPTLVTEIKPDEWYILTSSVPLIVLHSPDEFVQIVAESGPMKFRGKFADGLGKTETRTYTEPHIYVIEAKKSGKIELIMIPSGVVDVKSIIRQTLTVSGIGPNPPPIPIPDIVPDPPGPPTGVRVILLNNEIDTTADQLNTLNSTEIVSWLDANTVTWRKWDRTSIAKPEMLSKEDPILQTLWKNVSTNLPAGNIIIVATDTKVHINPITTATEALAFLNKIKAGK